MYVWNKGKKKYFGIFVNFFIFVCWINLIFWKYAFVYWLYIVNSRDYVWEKCYVKLNYESDYKLILRLKLDEDYFSLRASRLFPTKRYRENFVDFY